MHKTPLFAVIIVCVTLALPAAGRADEKARVIDMMVRTSAALERGDFQQAALHGAEAEKAAAEQNMYQERVEALIQVATAQQALGYYKKAHENLAAALRIAVDVNDPVLIGTALTRLGNSFIILNDPDQAEKYLFEAAILLRIDKARPAYSVALMYLGNVKYLKGRYAEAAQLYRDAAAAAENAKDEGIAGRAYANAAKAFIRNNYPAEASASLEKAYSSFSLSKSRNEKAYGLINVAQTFMQLDKAADETIRRAAAGRAEKIFTEALATAEEIRSKRGVSYAAGYLGQIYEAQKKTGKAFELTKKAILAGQEANAPEALYLWYWQNGRLLNAVSRIDDAINSYKLSVHTIQSIRQEFLSDCKLYNQLSFKDAVEPVFYGLIELMMNKAEASADPKVAEAHIAEARKFLEVSKTAELQDYFQNACVVANEVKTKNLDRSFAHTAIVHQILLPGRIEMIVSLPDGSLKRFATKVDRDIVVSAVRNFREHLEGIVPGYLEYSQQLYDWLIRPMEAELQAQNVEAILFIPDGPVRTIPMTALHDGNEYLVKKYAVVIAPGLTLTDPHPFPYDKINMLVAGLSEAKDDFSALPKVKEELAAVQEIFKGTLLFNNDYNAANLNRELSSRPYTVVHIASHGEFSALNSDSFLLTWDERMSMEQLRGIMELSRFRKESIELLALSACQTAAGDDQAALGLAGMGINAGAKSVFATLWSISDEAGFQIITEFYRQLNTPGISKVKALQQSQIKLMEARRFRHPFFWSPFVLIGNWM